jgi:hypothetical protein
MRMYVPALCLVIFTTFLASCDAVSEVLEEQFPQPPHKTIKIRDSSNSKNWPVKIDELAQMKGQDVLLALTKIQPDPKKFADTSYVESLITSVYALNNIGMIRSGLKLYSGTLNYWTGSGDYWVIFVLPDKSLSKISSLYLSKGKHHIYAENTQLYNIDFLGPIELDLEIDVYKLLRL